MHDHLNPPPARLVPQVRAVAATHNLRAEVGDMMAAAPGMTAKRAEALAPGLAHIATRHGKRDPVMAVKPFRAGTAGKDLDAATIKMMAADSLIMQDVAATGPEISEWRFNVHDESPAAHVQRMCLRSTFTWFL